MNVRSNMPGQVRQYRASQGAGQGGRYEEDDDLLEFDSSVEDFLDE